MKKSFLSFFVIISLVALLGSCSSYKQIPYFQNIDNVDLSQSQGLFDAKIMPKDVLTIMVNTADPDASKPFNQTLNAADTRISQDLTASLQGYLVDNDGNINFPIIGKIHVVGLTKSQCENLIRDKLMPYMSEMENPVVTVRMSSFHVTVMGEVAKPAVVPVTTEKMTILEALAQAGDLTIYGKRDNILLLREDQTGKITSQRINLNDANLINSPYYYLKQNDVLIVQPNKTKAKNSSVGASTSIWVSGISVLASLASMIVSIMRL